MPKLKVLVCCEFSGVVRRAFRALGHEAWSCDLLPSEDDSEWHLQDDVREVLGSGWDLLIAHPPCTYLCNSGVRWLSDGKTLNPERHEQMKAACDFFALLYNAPIERVAVENPVMHRYAKDYLSSAWRVPSFSQSIQPHEHGHGEIKRTCLWTRGLPALVPSSIVSGRVPRVHFASPGPERWKERSRTLEGIAAAMAAQWGQL